MTKIFLAGATGAIGRRLVSMLVDANYTVVGTTRSASKLGLLQDLGAEGAVVDVFDAEALKRVVSDASPDAIVHQLTDLPPGLDPARMAVGVKQNARLRREGTKNLVEAALFAGVRYIAAQSIAWAYAPGPEPHSESDPLDVTAKDARAISISAVAALEDAVLATAEIDGCALRYGQLYGPNTGRDIASGDMPVHVDAAAYAALLALQHRATGSFNVAEPNRVVNTDRIQRELGWRSDYQFADKSKASEARP